MIDIDRLKTQYISQVKSEFENPKISPFQQDWQKGVELLFDLIKIPMPDNVLYDAFLEALHQVLIENPTNYNYLASFSLYLEKYLALLASPEFVNSAVNGNKTLTPFLRALLRDGNSVPTHRDKLDKIRDDPEFAAHICRASCARNDVAHAKENSILPSWAGSQSEVLQNRNSILVVLLYATLRHYPVLKQKWDEKRFGKQPDIRPYLNEVIHRYHEWKRNFVAIQGVEIQLYAYEKPLTTGDFEKRQGSIRELRERIPEKQFMLLGEAGTGKTTTLQYLTLHDAEQCLQQPMQHNIPLYLELRRFTGDRSLWQDIVAELPFKSDVTTELFERGKVNLFLDGLNEVAKQHRKRVIDEIQSLIKRYPKMPLIVAGRELCEFLTKDEVKIPVFEYGRMTTEQVKEFIAKNTAAFDEITRDTTRQLIQQAINTKPIIAKLVRTPFVLFLMICVVKENRAIPRNDVELLDKFMESLYQREKAKDANFSKDEFKILISALALHITEQLSSNATLSQKEILSFLVPIKQQYGLDTDLLYILEVGTQLSILNRNGDRYGFAHEEFLAYYAELGDAQESNDV